MPLRSSCLGRLERAELTHGRGGLPERTNSFKHALVRDAAYERLLKARRRSIHARLAEVLGAEKEAPERNPELLAYHYERGGRAEPRAPIWRRGGSLSGKRL
jgi:predicted ATPase